MGVNLDFSWMEDIPGYQNITDVPQPTTGLDTTLISTYNANDLGNTVNNAQNAQNDAVDVQANNTDTNLTNFDYSNSLSNFDFSSLYSGGFINTSGVDWNSIINSGVNQVVDINSQEEEDENLDNNNNNNQDTNLNNNQGGNNNEDENLNLTENNNNDVDKSTWSSVYGETATVTDNTFMNFDQLDPFAENSGFTQATMNGEKVWVYEFNTSIYTGGLDTSNPLVPSSSIKIILTEDGKIINKGQGSLFTDEDYTIEKWDASKDKTGEWYDDYENYTSFNDLYFSIFGRDVNQNIFETLFGNETFSAFSPEQQAAHLFYTASGADKERLLAMIINGDFSSAQLSSFGLDMNTLSQVWDWDFALNQPMSKTLADKKKREEEQKKNNSKPKGFVMPKNVVRVGDEDAGKKGLRFTGMGTAGRNYASDPFAGTGLLTQPILNTPSLIAKKTAKTKQAPVTS
jgi:hypothetical protein